MTACGPRLKREAIATHPGLTRTVAAERSPRPPPRPSWLTEEARTSTGAQVAIVGQGSGESPEAAEGAARADLLRAIAERVQVDVDYQAESVLEHQRVGDGVDEHQTATESTRARADLGAAVRAAAQVVARHDELRARPGGQPQHLTFLLAKVPSALFDAARIERRLAKERARGAKVVAVTSAAPTSAPTRDLIAGLERRLLLEPRYTPLLPSLPREVAALRRSAAAPRGGVGASESVRSGGEHRPAMAATTPCPRELST